MQHNHANCNRSYRWIEGQNGPLPTRVISHVVAGRALSFELLPKGAFSTV